MHMFESATFKLTAWYLAILMTISIVFSIALYQVTFHEITVRLENFQRGITQLNIGLTSPTQFGSDAYRRDEIQEASAQLIASLFYVNLVILIGGGIGSYLLARRTLQPIEKAHEAMSRFTSDASHELRTPLAAMKTELEVALRDEKIPPEEMRELLESSLEEANKLIALSEVFLKLARLDHDSVDFAAVNMSDVLETVMKRHKKIRDRFDISTRKKAIVNGNEPALTELLVIMLGNAVKHSPDKSTITVRITEKLSSVMVEVCNDGDDIPPEQLERLFERFYRSDSSRTKSATNGYGLGLAIAKRITEIHGGTIRATSSKGKVKMTVALPSVRNLQAKLQSPTS